MTSNPHPKPAAPPNTFAVDAPQWLYQEIMRHIEPDLMLDRLPLLESIYAGETDDQRVERMQAYETAFVLFDQIYADVAAMVAQEAHRLKEIKRGEVLRREGVERGEDLRRIEDVIGAHFPMSA